MRGSGRTKAMVMAIPTECATTVMVHTGGMAHYVRRMIYDFRGKAVMDNCRIIVVDCEDDIYRLAGIRGNVAIDHAVYEWGPARIASMLRSYLGSISQHITVIEA